MYDADDEGDDERPLTTGFELRVALIDYNDRNEDGEPTVIHNRQRFTNYELARTDRRDFIEHVLRRSADGILSRFRSDDDDADESDESA